MPNAPRIFAQLGHPTGFLGRVLLLLLNRANRGMNASALLAMDLGQNEQVLEIGFGGGRLIAKMLASGKTVHITGVDISQTAVKAANGRFRRQKLMGQVAFFNTLPIKAAFSRAVCVNVIYFWDDVPAMMSKIYPLLAPDGKFTLAYATFSPDRITTFSAAVVEEQLRAAGYVNVTTTQNSDKSNGTYHCTVAQKPSE